MILDEGKYQVALVVDRLYHEREIVYGAWDALSPEDQQEVRTRLCRQGLHVIVPDRAPVRVVPDPRD